MRESERERVREMEERERERERERLIMKNTIFSYLYMYSCVFESWQLNEK